MTGSPLVGVITALPEEAHAVRHVLGLVPVPRRRNDPNRYVMADLGCGQVVSTTLAATGNSAAADAGAHLVRSFPSVRVVIMCGIALGVPRPGDAERDVRLGDVVVGSAGVIHYGHRRVTDEGATLRGDPMPASPLLLRGVDEIRIAQLRGERPWETWLEPLPSLAYRRPPADRAMEVFHGRIGSADQLMRSAVAVGEIARRHDLIAMEMEGAGVAGSAALGGRGCLVIRGISDYGDAEKSDLWKPYASLAAAAYLRVLLDIPGLMDVPAGAGASGEGLADLVDLMERVPSLQTPVDRDLVLELMGPPIQGKVLRDGRTRRALFSLAMVCREHRDGFSRLLAALAQVEGQDSLPLAALAEAVERYG